MLTYYHTKGGSAFGPNCASGAGGRIAVYATTSDFTGRIFAASGNVTSTDASRMGSPGTVYTNVNSIATLTLDNNGLESIVQCTITIPNNESSLVLDNLVVEGHAQVNLTVTPTSHSNLTFTFNSITSASKTGLVVVGPNTELRVNTIKSCAVKVSQGGQLILHNRADSVLDTLRMSTAALDVYL